MAETKKTTRVQFELPPIHMERLEKLKAHTEATSYSEVVKRALHLYERILAKQQNGTLMFVSPTGETTELIVLT